MSEYVVEDGIPVPSVTRKSKHEYPWDRMEVGQSVLVNNGDNSAISSAYSYGRRHNVKFVSKKTDDGTRIWRIA